MSIDISTLSAAARKQIAHKLAAEDAERQRRGKPALSHDEFDSQLERDYYTAEILPGLQSGAIASCEIHKVYPLLPASEYCGVKLPSAQYEADFVVTYRSGTIEVIEVKSKFVRRRQRDYPYRRRLFIELIARPNGYLFKEVVTGE